MLDAGTTEAGRPYFAMELLNGIPVLNNSWFRLCTDSPPSADCMQNNYECLQELIRLPDDAAVSCEIDGTSVNNLSAYHAESPAFGLNTTEGSLAVVIRVLTQHSGGKKQSRKFFQLSA